MPDDIDALEMMRREIQDYPRLLGQKALIAIARRQGWSLDRYHGSHAILRYDAGGYGHLCIQHGLQNQTTRDALERIYRPQRDRFGTDAAQTAALDALQAELIETLEALQREWEAESYGQLAALAERLTAYEHRRMVELDRAVGDLLDERQRAILQRETRARLAAQETIQGLRRREQVLYQRLHQRDRENQRLLKQVTTLQERAAVPVVSSPLPPLPPSPSPAVGALSPGVSQFEVDLLRGQIADRDRLLRRYRIGVWVAAIVGVITLGIALERRIPKPSPQSLTPISSAITPLIEQPSE